MMCGLLSNSRGYFGLNTESYVGLAGFDFSLIMYCSASLSRLKLSGISLASMCRLVIGDVLNAPKHIRRAWFWTRSSD